MKEWTKGQRVCWKEEWSESSGKEGERMRGMEGWSDGPKEGTDGMLIGRRGGREG